MARHTVDGWRPSEKQLHPLVQGALNRKLFKVPGSQWGKEVQVPDAILDFCVVVHDGSISAAQTGIHGVEVKMPDDADTERRDRQVKAMLDAVDYAWLVAIDGAPTYPNEVIGLIEYRLQTDDFIVHRHAKHLLGNNIRPVLRHLRVELTQSLDRLYAAVGAERPKVPHA